MATASQLRNRHSRPYPRKLGRFINLDGGLYGTLDLVALTPLRLELQTGEDFIHFDRDQAKRLRDTLETFLALHHHSHAAEDVERLQERIDEEERADESTELAEDEAQEEAAAPARRPRRRKSP